MTTSETVESPPTGRRLEPLVSEIGDHIARLVTWLYCGVCLCFWDGSLMCWVLIEGFAVAAGLFVGIPCWYVFECWKWCSRNDKDQGTRTKEFPMSKRQVERSPASDCSLLLKVQP